MKTTVLNHQQSRPKAQKISKEEIEKTKLGWSASRFAQMTYLGF